MTSALAVRTQPFAREPEPASVTVSPPVSPFPSPEKPTHEAAHTHTDVGKEWEDDEDPEPEEEVLDKQGLLHPKLESALLRGRFYMSERVREALRSLRAEFPSGCSDSELLSALRCARGDLVAARARVTRRLERRLSQLSVVQ